MSLFLFIINLSSFDFSNAVFSFSLSKSFKAYVLSFSNYHKRFSMSLLENLFGAMKGFIF